MKRVALLLCLALHGCEQPPRSPAPSTVAARTPSRAERDAECRRCHRQQTAQWEASLHKASFSDDAIRGSFERSPFSFCRNCHAPETAASGESWANEHGVSCVTCHLDDDGRILAAVTTPSDASSSPHAVVRSAAFSSPAQCEGCHQFHFPGRSADEPAALMQRTLWEHDRSAFSDRSCVDCHMTADASGAHDHRFDVSRNPAFLRRALASSARRNDEGITVELAPLEVGHAFPTGDLFRRIEVRAIARDARGRETDRSHRYLARHFPPQRRGRPDRSLEPDDRLTGPTSVPLALPHADADDTVHWRVSYQRVDHRVAHRPERSTLHGEIVLAEGQL